MIMVSTSLGEACSVTVGAPLRPNYAWFGVLTVLIKNAETNEKCLSSRKGGALRSRCACVAVCVWLCVCMNVHSTGVRESDGTGLKGGEILVVVKRKKKKAILGL